MRLAAPGHLLRSASSLRRGSRSVPGGTAEKRDMPNLLRKIVRSFGMDIVGYPPADTRTAHLAHLLNHQGVDFVFDIGANLGQYASALRPRTIYPP